MKTKIGSDLEFYCRDEGGYIWVSEGDGERKQICAGGGYHGNTLMAHSREDFVKKLRKWRRNNLPVVKGNEIAKDILGK